MLRWTERIASSSFIILDHFSMINPSFIDLNSFFKLTSRLIFLMVLDVKTVVATRYVRVNYNRIPRVIVQMPVSCFTHTNNQLKWWLGINTFEGLRLVFRLGNVRLQHFQLQLEDVLDIIRARLTRRVEPHADLIIPETRIAFTFTWSQSVK